MCFIASVVSGPMPPAGSRPVLSVPIWPDTYSVLPTRTTPEKGELGEFGTTNSGMLPDAPRPLGATLAGFVAAEPEAQPINPSAATTEIRLDVMRVFELKGGRSRRSMTLDAARKIYARIADRAISRNAGTIGLRLSGRQAASMRVVENGDAMGK